MTVPEVSVGTGRLLILTAAEQSDPVLAQVLDQLGWGVGTADVVIVEELERSPGPAHLPVNAPLWQHWQIEQVAKDYDTVLVTLFRGLGYFLMQTRPETVQLLPYRSMLADKLLGAVLSEFEMVSLELEEHLVRTYRDRVVCLEDHSLGLIDHRLAQGHEPQDLSGFESPAEDIKTAFFVFLPHPRMEVPLCSEERGVRITREEYLDWYNNGQLPSAVADLEDARTVILADEGYDWLGLLSRALDQGSVRRGMVLYDQRKPRVADPARMIPAIRSQRYLGELITSSFANRYLGYGPIEDFVTVCSQPLGPVQVSVVIVYHNRPQFIVDLLTAFGTQTEPGFELIVVDNGSDQLLEPVAPEGGWPFGLKVLGNMNAYPGNARNLGASLATGDYVIFFDDDNLPKPEFISEMLAAGQKDRFDLTLCLRDLFVTSGEDQTPISRGFLLSAPHLSYSSFFRNYIGDNVFIMRRDLFVSLGYTDFFEVGREDIEFLQFVRDKGLRIGVLPKDLYLYRLANDDKIGTKHLSHRTGAASRLDYGSYRKYFRSTGSFSERKYRQLVDVAFLRMQAGPGRRKGFYQKLRARASRIGWLRQLYYRFR